MSKTQHVMIHEFTGHPPTSLDDEGDERVGIYYQFVDDDENPTSDLVGPYRNNQLAEKAAQRAFVRGDY